MQDFGSNFLCCTPSYAMFIGETVRDMGIDPHSLKLRGGLFGAEPWTDNMRREIERLLDIRAYDIYGLSEIAGPGVSYDCELQNGLHVCEDYFYPEVIDPDTLEPLPDGGVRRAGLYLYRKGGSASDPLPHAGHLRPSTTSPCACGRTTVRMTKPAAAATTCSLSGGERLPVPGGACVARAGYGSELPDPGRSQE